MPNKIQITKKNVVADFALPGMLNKLVNNKRMSNKPSASRASARRLDGYKRWKRAQSAELTFWNKKWRSIYVYSHLDLEEYWRCELGEISLKAHDYAGKRILDIGCGPVGMIYHLPYNAYRLALDPLITRFKEKATSKGRVVFISGLGESLPFKDRSMDMVICFNVLDHVICYKRTLKEIKRILRDGGKLILMVHTYPSYPLVLRFISFFDRPHTYHFNDDELLRILDENGFRIIYQKKKKRVFNTSSFDILLPSRWKYLFGNRFMCTHYILAI